MIATHPVASQTRYRLKSYVYFGETEAGVWFEAGKASFVLRDRRLYPVVEKFVELIDNGVSVEEIVARAPERLRPLFPQLVASLLEHGMLQPVGPDHPRRTLGSDHDDENELYRVLEDRLSGEALAAAASRWAAARILVVGEGYAAKAAACALAASGAARMHLHCTTDRSAGAEAVARADELIAAVTERLGPAATLKVETAPGAPDPAAFEAADLIIYAADKGDMTVAQACDAEARRRGGAGAIAGIFRGQAVACPTGEAEVLGFEALAHWLPASSGEEAPSHGPASLAILGCVAAQTALFSFFGFDMDARRGRATVVSPWLDVETHALTPAPDSPVAPFVHAARHQMPDDRPLEVFETVKLALDPWFDPLFGPFALSSDTAIRQMPLLQYPIAVRRPGAPRTDLLAIGWGLELGDAGLRGIKDAVCALASPLAPAGAVIATGLTDAEWVRVATVGAVVASPHFARRGRAAEIVLDQVEDDRVQLLRRLLRFHDKAPVRAELHWSDLGPALAVRLLIGGQAVAPPPADRIEDAVAEALGRACSDRQLVHAAPDHWAGRQIALPPVVGHDDWRAARDVPEHFDAIGVTITPLSRLGLPPALRCGHVAVSA